MEPKIVARGQIILVGFGFFGDPFQFSEGWTEENEIGRLWNRFLAYLARDDARIQHVKNAEVFYEVHIEHEETTSKGHYEVFVGLEVEQLQDVPIEVVVKILPPTEYAVFTLRGEQMASDWSKTIFQTWMPGSGYQAAHKYGFQLYDQRFKGLENLDESALDVYVPIKAAVQTQA
jgi:AraC family transcriptional regulator